MIKIYFESHSTTYDNEQKIASGWFDVGLSKLGKAQATELGDRYISKKLSAIFCSDLKRSYQTAEIAFGNRIPIYIDKLLRECDYGDLTRHSMKKIESLKSVTINKPFDNGESYHIATARIEKFLNKLDPSFEGKNILIIGHRATQFGLEITINNVPIESAVLAPWKWQPGWEYNYS